MIRKPQAFLKLGMNGYPIRGIEASMGLRSAEQKVAYTNK